MDGEEESTSESDYTVEQMCAVLRAVATHTGMQSFEWGGEYRGTVANVLEAAADHLQRTG